MPVRPGAGKQDKDARGNSLDDVVVGLEGGDVLLHLVLLLLMLLDAVADLFCDVQVDFAHFLDVEGLGGYGVEANAHRVKEEKGFNSDVAHDVGHKHLDLFPRHFFLLQFIPNLKTMVN